MTVEPKPSQGNIRGSVIGCLSGALLLPCLITGITFLLAGVDGQFGLTMVGLVPVGAALGAVVGAIWEATHKPT